MTDSENRAPTIDEIIGFALQARGNEALCKLIKEQEGVADDPIAAGKFQQRISGPMIRFLKENSISYRYLVDLKIAQRLIRDHLNGELEYIDSEEAKMIVQDWVARFSPRRSR